MIFKAMCSSFVSLILILISSITCLRNNYKTPKRQNQIINLLLPCRSGDSVKHKRIIKNAFLYPFCSEGMPKLVACPNKFEFVYKNTELI